MSSTFDRFSSDLRANLAAAEAVLEDYNVPQWKVAMVVWNPANLNECVAFVPGTVKTEDARKAINYALDQEKQP